MMAALAPAVGYTVERSAIADDAIAFLSRPEVRVAVLYGDRGSRRRELIREWIIPRLSASRPVYYGDCAAEIPATVSGPAGDIPVEDALRSGGVVFLGHLEYCLPIADKDKHHAFADLLARVETGETTGMLVLITSARGLGQTLAFRTAAPTLMANSFEVPVVTFREVLRGLIANGDAGLRYEPDAVEALSAEAEEKGGGDPVELVRAVVQGFVHFKVGGGTVTAVNCKEIGGINGALEEFRTAQLDRIAERWGASGRKAAEVVLSDVAAASQTCHPPELSDIALRLSIGDQEFSEVVAWLEGEGGLLKRAGDGRFEIVPEQLTSVIGQHAERRQREVMRAWGLLRDGARSWSQLGAVLPRKPLDEIESLREFLPATDDEAALVVRSLLRSDCSDIPRIQYWLHRIRSRTGSCSVLMEALLSEDPTVRRRAAELLAGYPEAEVRPQLHRVVTEDNDALVREAALATLSRMNVDDLWPFVSQEALENDSPFQARAVAALRLFHEQRTVALLRGLVDSNEHGVDARSEAVTTLAAIGTPDAVRALVDIGLNDEDVDDRCNAAAALRSLESAELVQTAIHAIRDAAAAEHPQPDLARRIADAALRTLLSALIVVLNLFCPGIALIALRRVTRGLMFVAIGVPSLVYVVLARELPSLLYAHLPSAFAARSYRIAVGLWLTAWLISQISATRIAIAEERRRLEHPQVRRRSNLGSSFTATLLVAGLVPFAFVHGLAHAVADRTTTAIRLFGLELCGIACMFLGFFFFSGEYAPMTPFPEPVSRLLLWLYVGTGLLLFIGSFVWDVLAVVYDVMLRSRGIALRRLSLYEALAANRAGAEFILSEATYGSAAGKHWARRLVRHTAQLMPVSPLVRSLAGHRTHPGYLISSLTRVKSSALMDELAAEWPKARPNLRRWIVSILAGVPTATSLNHLWQIRSSLDRYGRIRYAIARLDYRLRLWPRTVIATSCLLAPLLFLSFYEVYSTTANPARPVLRMVQTPRIRAGMSDDQISAGLKFAATSKLAGPAVVLLDLFRDAANEPSMDVWKSALAESVGTAACTPLPMEIRSALFRAITDGVRRERVETAKALSVVNSSSNQCGMGLDTRRDLVAASTDLLRSAHNIEQLQLAIAALDTAGIPDAVEPLKSIAFGWIQLKNLDRASGASMPAQQVRSETLQSLAADALGRNISPEAKQALSEMEALPDRRLSERAKNLAAGGAIVWSAEDPLKRGDYDTAYRTAARFLEESSGPDPALRARMARILGQSAFSLALQAAGTPAVTGWASRSISGFEEVRRTKGAWAPGDGHTLAAAYSLRAERLGLDGQMRAAHDDAARAIAADPDSALGYIVQAWLLQKERRFEASIESARKAIDRNPAASFGYELLQNDYLAQAFADGTGGLPDREKLKQARDEFEDLSARYPKIMWPKRRLTNIYHDYLSQFDADRDDAFKRSYVLFADMSARFGNLLSERERLDFDANFLEARFTAGHFQEVIAMAAQLDKQLPADDFELRLPVAVLRYAAYVYSGDGLGANAQLTMVESLARQLPPDIKLRWRYTGTLAYLRGQQADGGRKDALRLIEAADALQLATSSTAERFAANRAKFQDAIKANRLTLSALR